MIPDHEVVVSLIDSWAYDHVCPPDFCNWCELKPITDVTREVVAADGTVMKQFGERQVTFGLIDDGLVTVWFQVLNVAKLTLSVSRLVSKGFLLCLGKQAFVMKGEKRCGLVKIGGLYYLPVRLRQPRSTTALTQEWLID